MRDMSLANVLIAKRRERGVTQEEFAAHVGISKGSVSKWENGNSFPDIALLPIIASYFDISIDALMNYSPQLSQAEIAKIYAKLAEGFAHKPFEEAVEECEGLIRKYYSCFAFVRDMALLYLNHAPLAGEPKRAKEIYQRAIKLCEHILQNCQKPSMLREATMLQAHAYIKTGEAEKVFELLCDENQMPLEYCVGINSSTVSQAHQMLGNMEKAVGVEQLEVYSGIMILFNGLMSYLKLNLADYEVAKEIFDRAEVLAEAFNMRGLCANNVAVMYTLGSRMEKLNGDDEKTVDMLTEMVDICTNNFFPAFVRGDSFFNKIDRYICESREGEFMVRDEATVKEHMLNDLLLDPAFESLHGNKRYDKLVEKMKKFVGGDS